VYDGSSLPVIFIIGVLPKFLILSLLTNLVLILIYPQYVSALMAFSGIISIFIGSFSALYQTKFKRFLAFSSIANLGYIALGFSCISIIGSLSLVLYILVYIINMASLIFMLLTVRDDTIKNVIEFTVIGQGNY